MKIRWTDKSIRLRITPAELERVCGGAVISQSIVFPGGEEWKVEVIPNADMTKLVSESGAVRVYLSRPDLAALNSAETEGVYFGTQGGSELRYFIEKDFPCVHPRPSETLEAPTETFVPPMGFDARKNNPGA